MIYHSDALDVNFQLILTRLEVFKNPLKSLDKKDGDIEGYLESFCQWQAKENPEYWDRQSDHPDHWDHGLMLTGLDLYDVTKKQNSVIGKFQNFCQFEFSHPIRLFLKVWLGFLECAIPSTVARSMRAITSSQCM